MVEGQLLREAILHRESRMNKIAMILMGVALVLPQSIIIFYTHKREIDREREKISISYPGDLNNDGTEDILCEQNGKITPMYQISDLPSRGYATAEEMRQLHPEIHADYDSIEKRVNEENTKSGEKQ